MKGTRYFHVKKTCQICDKPYYTKSTFSLYCSEGCKKLSDGRITKLLKRMTPKKDFVPMSKLCKTCGVEFKTTNLHESARMIHCSRKCARKSWRASNREYLRKSSKEYRATNRNKQDVSVKKWWDKAVETLNDSYVKTQLKKQGVVISKEMIELKRAQLKLSRIAYEKQRAINNS